MNYQEKPTNFNHVSDQVAQTCISFDEGMTRLANDQRQIHDIKGPLRDWMPVVTTENRFALRYRPTGRDYIPTPHALNHIAIKGRMSTWAVKSLTEPIYHQTALDDDGEKRVVYRRDGRDAIVLRDYVQLHLFQSDRMDQNKMRLFRTWNNGTLRAFLSDRYAIINNLWFMQTLQQLIPGGLLVHWRGDADEIFGNVLIPDTIRQENDSNYGGMLSISNSEIGTRKYVTCPSVFRAICMNGCILGEKAGVAIRGVHKGNINLNDLRSRIRKNLELQIPLLPQGITRMLGLRDYDMGNTPIRPLLAQLRRDYSIGKKHISGIVKAWGTEMGILGTVARTAFGLQAAITRYGQTLSNTDWLRFDHIGGNFANMSRSNWINFRKRAAAMDMKTVDKLVGEITLVG